MLELKNTKLISTKKKKAPQFVKKWKHRQKWLSGAAHVNVKRRAIGIPASAFWSAGRNSQWTAQPSHPPILLRLHPLLLWTHLQFGSSHLADPPPAGIPHFLPLSNSPSTYTDTRKNTNLGGLCSWTLFDGNDEWEECSKRRTGTLHSHSASGASTPGASRVSWGKGRVLGDGVIFFWAFLGVRHLQLQLWRVEESSLRWEIGAKL